MFRYQNIWYDNQIAYILIIISALYTRFIARTGVTIDIDTKNIIPLSTLGKLELIILVLSIGYIGMAFLSGFYSKYAVTDTTLLKRNIFPFLKLGFILNNYFILFLFYGF